MIALNKLIFPKVKFGNNVVINCESAIIKDGTTIEDNVTIEAKNIKIGFDTTIESNTKIKALSDTMSDFIIGDNCLIGFDNQILVPSFAMNDFSQLHNSCLCSGYKELIIGYNCWIGQGAILNSFERLTLGNNVRMGGSQIWTHVASGELLEGSNFYGSKPVILEDNVWLMGFGHLITPGVILARNSVVMAGSVVSKSTEPYKTYSGIPAKDISDKLPAWKKLSLADKGEMIKQFISEFILQYPRFKANIVYMEELLNPEKIDSKLSVIICNKIDLETFRNLHYSIFDLSTKKYLKQRSEVEIAWLKFVIGFRARFIPYN